MQCEWKTRCCHNTLTLHRSARVAIPSSTMAEDFTDRFLEITAKSLDEQAKFFLTTFILEFQGEFEAVLDICEQYRKFLPAGAPPESGTIDEFQVRAECRTSHCARLWVIMRARLILFMLSL